MPEASRTEPKIRCHGLWKVFGDAAEAACARRSNGTSVDAAIAGTNAIIGASDVNLEIAPGELFVIMGLSGSGKSTVLRCIAQLQRPSAGEVWLDDANLATMPEAKLMDIRRHRMGMVFQNFGLVPHFTALQNIAFPLKVRGESAEQCAAKANEMLDLVGLHGRGGAYPSELSGGQQQRVGIARSLAVEPEVWLLDEPFSALDPLIRKKMQDEFLRIQSVLHKSIVFITHDFQEALRVADRMAIMRDGAIVQVGRPVDLILNPVDDYVREFTRDVPWESVLCAADVAEAADGPLTGLGRVAADTPIDSLLGYLGDNADGFAVEAADGSVIGVARAANVVRALANGCDTAPADVRR